MKTTEIVIELTENTDTALSTFIENQVNKGILDNCSVSESCQQHLKISEN